MSRDATTRADGDDAGGLTLSWSIERVVDDGAVYHDHVSACGRFRLERGYGQPSASGLHDGWAVLERDQRGRLRWAEDAASVADAKRRAERRA